MSSWPGNVLRLFAVSILMSATAACTTSPPSDVNNLCNIFEEKGGWYSDAADARDEWGSPISVMMAMMHQESL